MITLLIKKPSKNIKGIKAIKIVEATLGPYVSSPKTIGDKQKNNIVINIGISP